MSSSARVAMGALVLAAAAAGGFFAYRSLAAPRPEPAAAAAPEMNPALPIPRAAPTRIPQITLPDIEGKPRAMAEWRGRPLLVNFWATWCEPCRREIPLLRKIRADHAAEGLEVIGIALDFHDAVLAYARDAGIDYPVLIAEENAMAAQAFGVGMGLPTTVIANRDGRIVATHVGELHEDQVPHFVKLALDTP